MKKKNWQKNEKNRIRHRWRRKTDKKEWKLKKKSGKEIRQKNENTKSGQGTVKDKENLTEKIKIQKQNRDEEEN